MNFSNILNFKSQLCPFWKIDQTLFKQIFKNECPACNICEQDSLYHFLIVYPNYKLSRNRYIQKYINTDEVESVDSLLQFSNKVKLDDLYYFIIAALKTRAISVEDILS